jgi:hypothetical protein
MLAACISRTPDVPLPAIAERIRGDELIAEAAAGHRSFSETRLQRVPQAVRPPDLRRSSAADHLLIDGRD